MPGHGNLRPGDEASQRRVILHMRWPGIVAI